MQAGFTFAGIVLGAFSGFKTGFGDSALHGFIGMLVEVIVGISIIGIAPSAGMSWGAVIGGFLLGNAVGSLTKFFVKS